MTITRNFKLCLNAGTQNAPYINVNQYDEGEEWVFDLYTEGGQKFTPSSGAIIGIKSDGNAILNAGTVNASGQVVITETQQMTAASGLAVFELLIEGETHGTANFIVNVERRPSDDAEFSDSDLSMLQEAIDAAEVINEILDEGGDPSEIIAENVDAWLDNHPEATTTVVDGAITAPKINNSLWDKILVNEEVSGNPASFDDGADDVPVSSLKVNLEPIQTGSGDPSPTNIRPISGHSSVTVDVVGKNHLPSPTATTKTSNGITVSVDNGVYSVSGAATELAEIIFDLPFGVTVTENDKCCYLNDSVNAGVVFYWRYNNTNGASMGMGSLNRVSTFSSSTTYNKVRFLINNGTVITGTMHLSPVLMDKNNTDETFEPYQSASYPYTLGQSVYGGTVDLATGVLTVTHVIVDMGSLTWSRTTSYAHPVFYVQINEKGTKYEGAMSSAFRNISSSSIGAAGTFANASNDGDFACSANNAQIFVRCDQYTTPADFKTAVTGYTLVYPLATPTTINLTPTQVNTLLGYNNISSSGTVDVIYHADTKLYIDKRIAELG